MSKDKKSSEDSQASGAPEAEAPGETPWAEGAEAESAQLHEDELAALEADNERLKDQLLRALAEMENLRQRTAREMKDARSYAVANFARDVLTVSDNLRRALEALPEEGGEGGAAPAALREGVEMTERGLQQMLEKHQVRRIDPKGERFDPNFHQAMFEVENKDVAAGTVVEVAQAGYVIGERMLRPAMVGVARGGAKPEKPAAPGEAAPESAAPGGDAAPQAPAQDSPAAKSPPGAKVDKSA